jgi:hypothetical protein
MPSLAASSSAGPPLAPVALPLIVISSLAGEPKLAPVAADSVTVKFFAPLNPVAPKDTAKVFAAISPAAQFKVPPAAVYWAPETAVPLLVTYFTVAAPLEPPVRLTLTVTLPADCATLIVAADSATLPGAAAAPLPLIVTTALAGDPIFAPLASDNVTVKVLEPVNAAELMVTAKVFAAVSPLFHDSVPLLPV